MICDTKILLTLKHLQSYASGQQATYNQAAWSLLITKFKNIKDRWRRKERYHRPTKSYVLKTVKMTLMKMTKTIDQIVKSKF